MKKVLCSLIMLSMLLLTSCGGNKAKGLMGEKTDADKTVILDGFSIDIEKQVLVDNEFATISIKDSGKTDELFKLYLEIENKLDAPLSVATNMVLEEWCSVNGYMVEDTSLIDENVSFDDAIPAGGRVMRTVWFSISELEMYGLTGIADIELRFFGIDNSDLHNTFKTDIIKITTDNSANYDYDKDTYLDKLREDEGLKYIEENIFDEQGLKIVSHAVVEKHEDSQNIYIEFFNTTDDTVKVKLSTIALNGIELDSDSDDTLIINPGTRRVACYTTSQLAGWEDEEIKAITVIEDFEYEFTCENYEDGEEITSGKSKIEVK